MDGRSLSMYYNSFDRLQNVANCFCISMALWYILCTKFSSLCKFLRQFAAKKFTPQELAGGEVKMIRKQIQESMIAPPPQKIMNMKSSQVLQWYVFSNFRPHPKFFKLRDCFVWDSPLRYIEKLAENRRITESWESFDWEYLAARSSTNHNNRVKVPEKFSPKFKKNQKNTKLMKSCTPESIEQSGRRQSQEFQF